MDVHNDKVMDKEYTNWLKVTLSLYYMKSGLHTFIQNEVNCLHQSLRQKIYGSKGVPLQQCSVCCASLVERDQCTRAWTLKNQCKSYCSVWFDELLALHVNQDSEKIFWNNCNITSWPHESWECAKVFLPRGKLYYNDGFAECDVQTLMMLIANCKHFHQKISPSGLDRMHSISTIRNSVMHAYEMKLSDEDRANFINQFIQLLEDPVSLKSNQDCEAAVSKIHEIDKASVDIILSADLQMKALKTAVHEVRQELGMQGESSMDTINSLKKEYKRLGEQLLGSTMGNVENVFKDTSAAWNYRVNELLEAWPSIEKYLLEELAPKNLLTFFEKESLLSAEDCKTMCQFSRSKDAEELLQRIKAKLPDAFFCLLHALNETEQEVVVHELMQQIEELNQATPMMHYHETAQPTPDMAYYTLKLELLKDGNTMHDTESKTRGYFDKGRIVFHHDMRSESLKSEPGSVVVYLRPLSKCTKETLAFFCQHGGMKNFVLDLLKRKDIFESLPEGELTISIKVHCYDKNSMPEVSDGQHIDVLPSVEKDVLRPPDSFTDTDDPQVIRQNLLLQYGYLLEEIEPLQFQDTFIAEGIWDRSFFKELKTINRRRARAADFLHKVLDKGNAALAALVRALKSSGNDDLANSLCVISESSAQFSIEGPLDGSIEVVTEELTTDDQEHTVWSCRLNVAVKKNENVSIDDKPVVVEGGAKQEDKKESFSEQLEPTSLVVGHLLLRDTWHNG
ncbi:hypothetical protein CHS0354_021926 [Potamilus streckersoni]|uniref:Uncharacterized protein n=1 Tax=Potamilus streckersoni TaxID=2493646 RepID=A0AAE0SKD8_9BIVA|nr:hypothetical protein CHS0354_021926 [Potamilus streckersoni]